MRNVPLNGGARQRRVASAARTRAIGLYRHGAGPQYLEKCRFVHIFSVTRWGRRLGRHTISIPSWSYRPFADSIEGHFAVILAPWRRNKRPWGVTHGCSASPTSDPTRFHWFEPRDGGSGRKRFVRRLCQRRHNDCAASCPNRMCAGRPRALGSLL
jgi:hypothetical protein